MRRTFATTAAVAAAALVLSACSTGDDTDAGTASSPSPAAEETAEPATESPEASPEPEAEEAEPEPEPEAVAVPAALDFTSPTVDGATFEGASLAGQDAVLYFWAPWCTICRREAPALPGVADEFTGEAAFLGVAGLSPDVSAMQGFVSDTGTESLTHLADTDGAIYSGFGVASQTTFAFVNDDGTIEIVPGPLSTDELRSRTQALVDG